MKTAEEWFSCAPRTWVCDDDIISEARLPDFIRQIQLDAYRAGGLDAANMVEELGCSNTPKGTEQAILDHFNNPKLEIPK